MYLCDICNYSTKLKFDYMKHCMTNKHISKSNEHEQFKGTKIKKSEFLE